MRPPQQHRYYGSGGYTYGPDHLSRMRRMYGSSLVETTRATPPPPQQQQWQHQPHQQRNNNGSSTIACRLCDQIFANPQDLIRHVDSHMSGSTRHHHKAMPFSSSPSHPLSRRESSISASCNPSRFPSTSINNPLHFSPRPPLWSSASPPPSPSTCTLRSLAPPPLCVEGGSDGPLWPHLSQGVENGPPSPLKTNTTTTDSNDLTMPFIRQLEQPFNPHFFRFVNGGGGYMDGFELLDLTLKL